MKKILIALAITLMCACTSNRPATQDVNKIVSIPCLKSNDVPTRPAYESYTTAATASDGDKVLAITRDWARSRPYEARLEAIIKGCEHD